VTRIKLAWLAVQLLAVQPAVAGEAWRTRLPLAERVFIATQLYTGIRTYFAHWDGVPGYDLDAAYRAYLDRALASDDRRAFSLASTQFIASLHNGHSLFKDEWLNDTFGQRMGFQAYPVEGKWTVRYSVIKELRPGDVITNIDGEDFWSFYRRNSQFISASDERSRQEHFFYRRYLFPLSFRLQLDDGREIRITRSAATPPIGLTDTEVKTADGVLFLHVPGFDEPRYEQVAVEAVKSHPHARAIVIDVRGTGGGSTPANFAATLMERPYRFWTETTPVTLGVVQVDQETGQRTFLRWENDAIPPQPDAYKGPVYIVTDVGCFSACEDFVGVFKSSHRATIVGERTAGSTGQSYRADLGDGFAFQVSTKREFFPDGSPFEGIGIAPDIEVQLTIADLRAGRDSAMAKATDLAKAAP
jgi:carboxyl-terminal processing protease